MPQWTEGLTLPKLEAGSHESADEGRCAMEMVAFIERLSHSDSPPCTCPAIAAYVRAGNDAMDDETRQRLWAYLPRLVGTVSPEHERQRAEALAMHAVRTVLPIALDAIGLHEHAAASREAGSLAEAVRAARDAAWDAAWAAEAAAWAAAWAVGGAAGAAWAAWATRAAAGAAGGAAGAVWDAYFLGLERVLAIGPSGVDESRARAAVEDLTCSAG